MTSQAINIPLVPHRKGESITETDTQEQNTTKMAQENRSPKITLSRTYAKLGGSTKAASPRIKSPLASHTRSFTELGHESQTNSRTISAPEHDLKVTEDEAITEHPLAWDVCSNCQLRGRYNDMFHCKSCEKAFHPLCISAQIAAKTHDPRYHDFLCPGCAENNAVLKLLANDE